MTMFEMLMAYVYAVKKDAERLRRFNHTPRHAYQVRRTHRAKAK